MKALVLEISGRRAIVLLPGGEIRTMRVRRGWQIGAEVSMGRSPLLHLPDMRLRPQLIAYPVMALAAFMLLFAGIGRIGGNYADHVRPPAPLSPGSELIAPADTPEPTDLPEATDAPEPTETPVATDLPEPTIAPEPTEAQRVHHGDHHDGCDDDDDDNDDDDDDDDD